MSMIRNQIPTQAIKLLPSCDLAICLQSSHRYTLQSYDLFQYSQARVFVSAVARRDDIPTFSHDAFLLSDA